MRRPPRAASEIRDGRGNVDQDVPAVVAISTCDGPVDAVMTEPVPGSTVSDAELIERIASRDHAAFDELHRRYARAVLGMALRRIGDRGRAEDAAQETFAAIWRSADRYDPQRGPGAPWLYTVARNTIVNGLRRTPEPPSEPRDGVAEGDGPPEQTEAAWEAWRIHRALEGLTENERSVIELAYWSGLSQTEVAEFLQIPLGTVKTRTRAALHRLADALEDDIR
jgi:RNA polymerase sigma-70 factor (ECF subfamily)